MKHPSDRSFGIGYDKLQFMEFQFFDIFCYKISKGISSCSSTIKYLSILTSGIFVNAVVGAIGEFF